MLLLALVAASISNCNFTSNFTTLFSDLAVLRSRARRTSSMPQTKTLIDAVAELKLEYPDAIAKVIHGLLTKQEVWADESLSRVKKACS